MNPVYILVEQLNDDEGRVREEVVGVVNSEDKARAWMRVGNTCSHLSPRVMYNNIGINRSYYSMNMNTVTQCAHPENGISYIDDYLLLNDTDQNLEEFLTVLTIHSYNKKLYIDNNSGQIKRMEPEDVGKRYVVDKEFRLRFERNGENNE